jgi:hypothetical protein
VRVSLLIGLLAALAALSARAETVALFDGHRLAPIIHEDSPTAALAADLLARDLKSLTGQTAESAADLGRCGSLCIVMGDKTSSLVAAVARETGTDLSMLDGQWERYRRLVLRRPGRTYLLIAGSDPRGMVWGTVDLSREMGVSAWEWWADIAPRRVATVAVDAADILSDAPSVRYRGIFLNDEDWGLEPWAAKTYDPKTGNIGPKTYARIFELMWRLKANTLWPAMHSVSNPFFGDPGNPRLAGDYSIVVGTSHAEPMMRNNLREWDMAKRGPFNFLSNRDQLADYWRQRVSECKAFDGIYSVGLRGIHDGPMEGASTAEQRRDVLRDAIGLQRDILSKTLGRPAESIPQALTVYKEVEDAYNAGLSVPDDVTLVWSDDNYGYLGRLSSPDEAKRSGGAGIYYHISYWGRPHDYLWLGTTHPGLIREEMGRAYDSGARREWILNVGDIKPGEYLTQYFLDLAFDARALQRLPRDHLTDWFARQFGPETAGEMADIMMDYYALAFERKPEFMGWGEVEPVTANQRSAYVQSDGEEAQVRLAAYRSLQARAEALGNRVAADRQDAYFELVLYPVRSAAGLNQRVLQLDLADLYARQGRASANHYAALAHEAEDRIVADTAHYNDLAGGKWRFMMDMAPRRLPVFDIPAYPHWSDQAKAGCDVAFESAWWEESNSLEVTAGKPATRTVTLFGHQAKELGWKLERAGASYRMSEMAGKLTAANGYEQRLTLLYDGSPPAEDPVLSCGGRAITLHVHALPATAADLPYEDRRRVVIPVTSAPANPDWEIVPQLGSQGASLRSRLDLPSREASQVAAAAALGYRFATSSVLDGKIRIVLLPTHPVTPSAGLRLGVSLDGGPVQLLDFATQRRSDEWRGNVLSNTAVRTLDVHSLAAGTHSLRLFAADPGLVLDRVEVELDGAVRRYGAPPLNR